MLLLTATLSLAASALASSNRKQQPHIALIVSDDLGWDDVGFRSHQIKTPIIDALAAGGRVLDHYYGAGAPPLLLLLLLLTGTMLDHCYGSHHTDLPPHQPSITP
jgi:hypothetical protein